MTRELRLISLFSRSSGLLDTGLAIRNVVRQLRPLRSATVAINATPPQIPADKQALLEAIHRGGLTH